MVKVIEEKEVPRSKITCSNCDSILEYGNADLYKDYEKENKYYTTVMGHIHDFYYFNCPVCGCKVSAGWVIK